MPTLLEVMIACRRLQWLGHVARMDDLQAVFGWMESEKGLQDAS